MRIGTSDECPMTVVRSRRVVRRTLLAALVAVMGCTMLPVHADLPDTVARIKPSVLVVGTFRATDSPRFRMRGTGFVVADGNLAITNAHVLPESTEDMATMSLVVQVRRPDGKLSMRQTTVLAVDRVHDLALMRFEGAAAPAMRIGDSQLAREGQTVAFIGFPIGGALGFSPVTHQVADPCSTRTAARCSAL